MNNYDVEEQELLTSFENNEWKSEKTQERLQLLNSYVDATLAENQKIILSLSKLDLESLQILAKKDNIPYQSLASSILHKYLTGRLVEKSN